MSVFAVQVPRGVRGGQDIEVETPHGTHLAVTVPHGLRPGQEFEIEIPTPQSTPHIRTHVYKNPLQLHRPQQPQPPLQLQPPRRSQHGSTVRVTIPEGVEPGHQMIVRAPDGRRNIVTVPQSAAAGTTLLVEFAPATVSTGAVEVEGSLAPSPDLEFARRVELDLNQPREADVLPGTFLPRNPHVLRSPPRVPLVEDPPQVTAQRPAVEVVECGGLKFTLPPPPHRLNDANVAVHMSHFQNYWFARDVKKFTVGLAWDSFCDVDYSAALFDVNGRLADIVNFRKLRSSCGSIKHSGDDVSGQGSGPDETITVNLRKIPQPITHVIFCISVYSPGKTLDDVRKCTSTVRSCPATNALDSPSSQSQSLRPLLFRYRLNHATVGSANAVAVNMLTRVGAFFKMTMTCIPVRGKTLLRILRSPVIPQLLATSVPAPNKLLRVSLRIDAAHDLYPQDSNGKADPYVEVRFRTIKYKTPHRTDTLDPVFHGHSIPLGVIDSAEDEPLQVCVFDKDVWSHDDFVGGFRLPAAALYSLGPGKHRLTFQLHTELQTPKKLLCAKAHEQRPFAGSINITLKLKERPLAFKPKKLRP